MKQQVVAEVGMSEADESSTTSEALACLFSLVRQFGIPREPPFVELGAVGEETRLIFDRLQVDLGLPADYAKQALEVVEARRRSFLLPTVVIVGFFIDVPDDFPSHIGVVADAPKSRFNPQRN